MYLRCIVLGTNKREFRIDGFGGKYREKTERDDLDVLKEAVTTRQLVRQVSDEGRRKPGKSQTKEEMCYVSSILSRSVVLYL